MLTSITSGLSLVWLESLSLTAMGFNNVYEHARIDFARQEGFWTRDVKVMLTDSIIDGSSHPRML